MRTQRTALLCLIVALIITSADYALAQKIFSRSASPNVGDRGPVKPSGGGGYHGGGFRGPGGGVVVPGIIVAVPQGYPPDGPVIDGGPSRPQRRNVSGAPGANERRLVPDEVVIELSNASTQQVDALQRRFNLTRIESQPFQLSNTTLYRWRIPDRRSVATVVRALEGDRLVASAQPNYVFTLQESDVRGEGDPAQYELAKLHLPQAHALARGSNVLVAVIDSGIDEKHPELAGSIADSFDALAIPASPHKHGTAIAGLIAAHARLMGAAPDAKILAIRAFDAKDVGAKAPRSIFSKASTGRRRMAHASSI